jgi:hypothetical protein
MFCITLMKGKKMKNIIIASFVILLLIMNPSMAQDRTGKLGIVLLEDFTSDPLNYGFSLWINNSTSIELIGGFENIDLGDNSGTLYNIGVGGIYHFGNKKIVPFVGSRFLYSSISSENKSYSDFKVGVIFGAEYFFSEWISLSGEFQLNYIETAKEFSPSYKAADAKIIKTARFIALRFYL